MICLEREYQYQPEPASAPEPEPESEPEPDFIVNLSAGLLLLKFGFTRNQNNLKMLHYCFH